MLEKISFRQRVVIVSLLFLVVVSFLLVVAISRIGKTRVSVELIPSDSQLYLDGKKSNPGDLYIKPGKHTFTAKKNGFIDDKVVLYIDNEPLKVGLVPDPKSEEAINWLAKNPEIQLKREGIGAQMSSLIGGYVTKNTPIINELPYTSVEGPFTLDYGSSPYRLYGSFIVVSDSTPVGREAALAWIRKQGYDPTNFDIRFDDFSNPLLPKDINEGRSE